MIINSCRDDLVQDIAGNRRVARNEMAEPLRFHGSAKHVRPGQEPEASFSELGTLVPLGQRQGGRHRLHVDPATQPRLAQHPQPVEPVPVRGHEQVLRRHDPARGAVVGERVRVDVMEEPREGGGIHVVHPNDARHAALGLGLLHGAEELRLEHHGAGGQDVAVRAEEPVADDERHVGAGAVPEHARQVVAEDRLRDLDDGVSSN